MRSSFFILIHLIALQSAALAGGIEKIDNGWYDSRHPVPVMHLEGGIEEVARGHGAFVARIAKGRSPTLDYMGSRIEHMIDSNPVLKSFPFAHSIVSWLYGTFIRKPLIESTPERYRNAYAEFAKASGVPLKQVWDAVTVPDATLRLVSLLYRTEAGPDLPKSFGCTSVIWNTGSASVLHGRNLDYEGVGLWDRDQVIMHVLPTEGLAYVALMALGAHAPGITAFNEAGLTLAIHQLNLNDTQAHATPIAVISAEVIRNSRSIDDAIAIIKGFPRTAGWAYVLSQGHDRATVETSASEVAIRRSSVPFFYQTNHVSSPALAKHEIFYDPAARLDSFSRAETLEQFSKTPEAKMHATPEGVVRLLGERHRAAAGTISKLFNIQSVVMNASKRRLWIGVGDDRHAPNEGRFIEYRWSDLRSADPPEVTTEDIETSELTQTPVTPFRELLHQAIRQRNTGDAAGAAKSLEEYVKLAESSAKAGKPLTGTWGGLYLSVWNELASSPKGQPPESDRLKVLLDRLAFAMRDPDLKTASTRTSKEFSRHYLSLGYLFKGRVLDLLGKRSQALLEYELAIRQASYNRVRKAAEVGVRHPFSIGEGGMGSANSIDWCEIDLFRY
jgi:hypothetical protein